MPIQDIVLNTTGCRLRNASQELAALEKTATMLDRIASINDEMAFEMLLHRHKREILCSIRRIIYNPVAVEDVFQESSLRIWRGAIHFKATDEVVAKGWIMRIVRNTALNFRRKEKKLSKREVGYVCEPSIECSQLTKNLYEIHLHNRIFDEIRKMPEKYRKPLLLRFHFGLNGKALSIKWHCGTSTARARVHRALSKLREIIRSKSRE